MKKTRKPVALLLSVLMLLALFAPLSIVSFAEGEEPEIYVSGTCGAEGDNLTWTLSTDGVLTIRGTGEMKSYRGQQPDLAPWHKSTIINTDYPDVVKVVVEENVTSIGDFAFYWLGQLSEVSLPSTVTHLGENCFFCCESLETLELPAGLTKIDVRAFCEARGLTHITIPEGVSVIEKSAFDFCTSLTSITLPDSLTTIGDYAFRGTALTTFHVSAGLETLGFRALPNRLVTAYTADENNPNYVADEAGCLYTKDMQTLIYYPIANTRTGFTVPAGVKTIAAYAFSCANHLETVNLPDTLETIEAKAFSYCQSLPDIELPAVKTIGNKAFLSCIRLEEITLTPALTSISEGAFSRCEALTDVYYHCPKEAWDAIEIGSNNDPLLIANFHYDEHVYDDGVITTEPTYTEDGVKTFTCTLCGDSYTEPVPAIAAVKTGQIGPDVYYTLYENGHADIYGTGDTYAGFYANHTTFFGFSLPVEITSLEVQPGVTGLLSEFGFSHLLKLQSVKLPASLTSINYAMFHFCLSLESIDVDPENPAYTTVDGVLYNKSVTELVHYPLGKKDKTYTVPAGVKRIEQRAFEAVRNLEEIILPDSVETICFGAFMGAPDLNTVHLGNSVETIDDYAFYRVEIPVITIPGSVKQIGDWAFGYRLEFTDVYYPCPKEAWDKIEFGSDNEPLLNATLHFGEHAYDGGEITASATCGKDGIKTFTCQNCGDTYTETIPAAGTHRYTGVVTTKPTCTEDGVETFTCAVCGDSYTAPVAATGHDWSEWIVTRNPSETSEGEAYRYCKNDRTHIETKTIDKLPETHEQSGNPLQRILDWVQSFFDRIGEAFRNLFRF